MEHIENDNKYEGLAVNKGVAQPPAVNPYLNKSERFAGGNIRQPNIPSIF